MTPQQLIAFASPCFDPEECMQKKFFWSTHTQSVGMTFNIGLE